MTWPFYILSNNLLVIPRQREGDYEGLLAVVSFRFRQNLASIGTKPATPRSKSGVLTPRPWGNASRKLETLILKFLLIEFTDIVFLCDLYNFLYLQGPSFYPMSHPPLPTEEITEHQTLYKIVLDLATILDCRMLFTEPGEVDIHGTT